MTLRYLIDTDWVIHYLNGNPNIVSRLQELKDQGLALSVVSLGELYEGVYFSADPQGEACYEAAERRECLRGSGETS